MPVLCLFTLDCHGNFTAGVTLEQPDLLCSALVLNIELLSFIDVILECKKSLKLYHINVCVEIKR